MQFTQRPILTLVISPASASTARWWETVGWLLPTGSSRSQLHAVPSGADAMSDSSCKRTEVGPTGKAYGLDMTDEMLVLARRNAAEAHLTNVKFLKGHIESVSLPDATVDVVISNCVINLSTDKASVSTPDGRGLGGQSCSRRSTAMVASVSRSCPSSGSAPRASRTQWRRWPLGPAPSPGLAVVDRVVVVVRRLGLVAHHRLHHHEHHQRAGEDEGEEAEGAGLHAEGDE